jgi:Ca-activated chloride channel family protein
VDFVRMLASSAFRTMAFAAALVAQAHPAAQAPTRTSPQFRFESRVDLVNVTVTVSDEAGRYVPGLQKEDFALFEDDRPQPVALFFSERVPVSLGIAIDTSGSMQGGKYDVARKALDRFLGQLLDSTDEIFLCRFDDEVQLLQRWTTNRELLSRALGRISPRGATTLYDAIAEAVPLAQTGLHRKKALVVISDGNDTSSYTELRELKQTIHETEVLVYAIGIDSQAEPGATRIPPRLPVPVPIPGRGGRIPIPPAPPPGPSAINPRLDARVNADALRQLTDDSGGRTEIIRTVYDLDLATASVADELSRQYYLGYESPSAGDGRWHRIRVEVPGHDYHVRARTGFFATPGSDSATQCRCP